MVQNALVLSDLHLGAATSLLTAYDARHVHNSAQDTGEPAELIWRPLAQEVVQRLLSDVRDLVVEGEKIDQCILLGDIFDFSFAPYGLSMKNAQWFLKQLVDSQLFRSFVYVPGNHDHHIWQQIIEHSYLMNQMNEPPLTYPKTLPPSVTIRNTFLDDLLPEPFGFEVTYPNYTLEINGVRIYFHHGHFLQKLYMVASGLLSEILQTQNIEDLEVLNAPFLEFGWYNLCQAYNLGDKKLIDRLYFMYKNQQTEQLDRLLRMFLAKLDRWDEIMDMGQTIRPRSLISRLKNQLMQWVGPYFLKRLFFKHSHLFGKRHLASTARYSRLSEDLQQSAIAYITKYLISPEDRFLNNELVFIFGHTHEPEVDVRCSDKYGRQFRLYNTGGWLLDRVGADRQFILPQMSPIYIAPDGTIHPIPLTQNHQSFFETAIADNEAFNQVKPYLLQT